MLTIVVIEFGMYYTVKSYYSRYRVWYVQYCEILPYFFVNSIDVLVQYK